MSLLTLTDRQVAPLRRLRRNAWIAIGLCAFFHFASIAMPSGPVHANAASSQILILEQQP